MSKNDPSREKHTRSPPDGGGRCAGRGTEHLHLFTLCGLAVAQPILDLLARHAEFFVVRRSSPAELLALVVFLLMLPLPAVLVQAAVARLAPRLFPGLHALFIACFSAVFLLQIAKAAGFDSGHSTAVACAALACGLTWAYLRWRTAGMFLTALSISLLVIPAAFLLHPQISKLVFRGGWVASASTVTAKTPIFFILFDELALSSLLEAERRIDARRFPNLASFAERALWFENAITVSDFTHFAVPAILTGTFPDPEKLPTYEDYPQNLFTLLGDSYSIWADEPVTSLCPPELNQRYEERLPWIASLGSLLFDVAVIFAHQTLPSSYARHFPPISQTWGDFGDQVGPSPPPGAPAERSHDSSATKNFGSLARIAVNKDRAVEFQRFVDAPGAGARRNLYFVHLMLPHVPWEYLPSGKMYRQRKITGLSKNVWGPEELHVLQGYQRYLLQLGFVDRLVGRFLSALEELDLFDRSLIVMLSDHGTSFVAGTPRRKLSGVNPPDILPMLLLIKPPGLAAGEVRSQAVSSLDVLPTVADVLGLQVPLEGRSLLDPAYDRPSTTKIIHTRDVVRDYDPSIFEAKYHTLRWKLDHFGTGADPGRIGARPEIHGRPVADFEVTAAAGKAVHLDGALLFSDVDKESDVSLSRITGEVRLAEADTDCCELAVAINGTIEATTRTSGESKSKHFSTLVPEASLRDGANTVEVVFIDDSSSSIVLRRSSSKKISVSDLEMDPSGQIAAVIVNSRRIPIDKRRLRGRVDLFRRTGDHILIRGWAADLKAPAPVGSVQLYYRKRLLAAVSGFEQSPGIERRFDAPELARAGFQFELPGSLLKGVERGGIQIVALARNRRAAIEVPVDYRLEESATGSRILGTDGTVFALEEAEIGGSYRLVETFADRWKIAVRVHRESPRHHPHKLLTFQGRRLHSAKIPNFRRAAGPESKTPDPRFEVRSNVPRRDQASEFEALRIFVLTRSGIAAELRQLPAP